MLKTAINMLIGALITAAVSTAFAVTGNVPLPGFQAVDGTWLLGLAGGTNYTYQSGITAAGTTQATATQLNAGIYMLEVDTAGTTGLGVALPPCVPGTQLILYNNGGNPIIVYPAIANNLLTAAQDTINSVTTLSGNLASHAPIAFACAKAGNWNAS